jgi:hypothetical protein
MKYKLWPTVHFPRILLFFLSNLMPQSSAATEERSHQERSEYFITEVISFMFTPYVIVILRILI